MTARDSEGLMARIRQLRRLDTVLSRPTRAKDDPQQGRLEALELRVTHLEGMIEGLQDSVHRESERHGKMIAELQNQIEPGAMGAALADDARNRGL